MNQKKANQLASVGASKFFFLMSVRFFISSNKSCEQQAKQATAMRKQLTVNFLD